MLNVSFLEIFVYVLNELPQSRGPRMYNACTTLILSVPFCLVESLLFYCLLRISLRFFIIFCYVLIYFVDHR